MYSGLFTGMGGYVAVDNVRKEITLTTRGTTNLRNFVTDAQFIMGSVDDAVQGGKVHSGFINAWKEISNKALAALATATQEYPNYHVVVVGHSLGAGTATLAASYVRQTYPDADLFTYGSPRPGNDVFVNFVSQQGNYRVEHYNDLAANILPKIIGYRHTDTEYWLNVGPITKADYDFNQVTVCHGDKDGQCSNSVFPDLTGQAHRYILSDLYACGGLSLQGIIAEAT